MTGATVPCESWSTDADAAAALPVRKLTAAIAVPTLKARKALNNPCGLDHASKKSRFIFQSSQPNVSNSTL
jgi:hypothetical protein